MSDTPGLLPLRPSDLAFIYNGHEVKYDDERLIDVTAMWRAVGSPKDKSFYEWKRREGVSFIRDLVKSLNTAQSRVLRTTQGRTGGSWAHWQIALAYAKYLSNEFHRFVNEAFREWVEEKADPGLKADRAVQGYHSRGYDEKWVSARMDGIVKRNYLTDTLQTHGVQPPYGYARCTDAINREVLGGSAKEINLAKGLPAKAKTRDHLTVLELGALKFAETMAEEVVKMNDARGNAHCEAVCEQAGQATYQAMTVMGLRSSRARA